MEKNEIEYDSSRDYNKLLLILLVLATLFMGIAYAAVNIFTINVEGSAVAKLQTGLFITEAVYSSDVNADLQTSEILNCYQTNLKSRVALSTVDNNSSITYSITIYNNSVDSYTFSGVDYLTGDQTYDNENITFDLSGLTVGDHLASQASVTFTITFHYKDSILVANNILNSYLNFNFTQDVSNKTLADLVFSLVNTSPTEVISDSNGNARYYGKSPSNYVTFNGESWRIIGAMKDIDDGTGNKENRVKIVRDGSIGTYSWDSSGKKVNVGNGINEWSQADLNTLLNTYYYNQGSSRSCYIGTSDSKTTCDFSTTGLGSAAKEMISDVVWQTGATGTSSSTATVFDYYTLERGSYSGNVCTNTGFCTESIERTTSWIGKVGLLYPSDYGYATAGGTTTDRESCLSVQFEKWDTDYSDCYTYNWIESSSQWTLTPSSSTSSASGIVYLNKGLKVCGAALAKVTRPTVYLLANVGVDTGDGTSANPYTLKLL